MLLFVILDTKYGITTYLNFLSIANFCSIKFKLLWLSELPRILDNKLSATKTKDNQFLHTNTKLPSYLMSSSNLCSTTFEPFWLFEFTSHCWQQALSYKKERPELFAYLANKYGITYLPQLPASSSSFLSINTLCAYIRFSEVVIALLVQTTGGSWQLTSCRSSMP